MAEARPFRTLVAERVRQRRHEIGVTQDQLARKAWASGGPSMTRGVIAAVERGTVDLPLMKLGVLARALGTDLKGLLGSGGKVFIDQGVAIEVDEILAQLLGRPTPWDLTTDGTAKISRARHGTVVGYLPAPLGVAEHKAARKLGVSPEQVAEAAGAVWEKSLAEERDARLKAMAPEGA